MRPHKISKVFLCVFVLSGFLLFLTPLIAAQEAKLAWDPPEPATGILGYRVYIGTSTGQYTTVVDVGNQTEVPLSSLNIIPGTTYYIAVKSYDSTQESPEFSNEINTDYLLVSTQGGTLITETQGGPFQSSLVFSLRNLGSRALSWRATPQQDWLNLSSSGGDLGPNETIAITASINSAAASFVSGDYKGLILFENSTNSQGNISVEIIFRVVSSGVTPPPPPPPPPPAVVIPPLEPGPGKLFVAAENQTTMTEFEGGPFSSTVNFLLANTGGESLNWAASTQRWVKLSLTGGQLKSGETVRVSASIDALAASFSPGTYYASILFQSLADTQQYNSMRVVLEIVPPGAATVSKIGIFRREAGLGFWYIDNSGNGGWDGCSADGCHGPFGGFPGDIPLVGKWDGDGNKIGIYRQGNWYLDLNGNLAWDGCNVDFCIEGFGGSPGDVPIAGDWSGEGITQIGLYRSGSWILDNGNGILEACGVDTCLGPFGGLPGDVPVVGDWTGDGTSKIGIYRNGQWFLDINGNGKWDGCQIDSCLDGFGGLPGDIPVVGDWAGNRISRIGFYRNGQWYLDYNGNGVREGCETDRCFPAFGEMVGDLPVVF